MKLSSASMRAQNYRDNSSDWYTGFAYTGAKGLGYEEGINRRDPSSVLKVNDKYYVWYTKSVGPHFGKEVLDPNAKKFPWDYADIYYATSVDGINWQEQGCAVHRGGKGEYDERTICTPDVLEHNGKYYLVYQAIPQGSYTGCNENVAMAVAESPDGPFIKTRQNILQAMPSGNWFGDVSDDSYNKGKFFGLTHDPSLYYYNRKFYLYYKCSSNTDKLKFAGKDTRWGVAISEDILGPYEHSDFNPVTNSGHETMLWHYNGGIGALLNRDGPEKNTIQYAKDGVNFEIMAVTENTPQAGGAFRGDNTDLSPLEGIRWGLCHCDERASIWNYIIRFDLDQRNDPYKLPLTYPIPNTQWF